MEPVSMTTKYEYDPTEIIPKSGKKHIEKAINNWYNFIGSTYNGTKWTTTIIDGPEENFDIKTGKLRIRYVRD